METDDHTIVALEAAGIAAAATVAASAFANDPMFTFIFPSAAQRARSMQIFMVAALRYGVLFGKVYTTADGAGSALWLTPEQPAITPGRMLRSGMATLPFRLGWAAFRRFLAVTTYGEHVHAQSVHAPHWYLLNLAVDPSRQRQGVGAALLRPVLAQADDAGQPCYLETNNPSNLPFYAGYGFTVAHAGHVPNGGPAFWGLVRAPQAHR